MQLSAAVKRKVSSAQFTAYVNPGMNAEIHVRGRNMKLWMMIGLLIKSECIKQRSFIAFMIVI